ncbi:MAG TPA: GNAT family N-acetyltransferase [Anaerolineaceae bacterium]|nr:GNAT family N-acetyltransferase [Anaerolineaceae bacterium]
MEIAEYRQGRFLISTDPALLQIDVIHNFLSNVSYWAQGRRLEVVKTSIENSLCFGIYSEGKQVGFARVVTDYATFAWLCDVFILPEQRGYGLGKWLIECVVSHPALARLKRMILATQDAHELYRRYGDFVALPNPERWMVRINSE